MVISPILFAVPRLPSERIADENPLSLYSLRLPPSCTDSIVLRPRFIGQHVSFPPTLTSLEPSPFPNHPSSLEFPQMPCIGIFFNPLHPLHQPPHTVDGSSAWDRHYETVRPPPNSSLSHSVPDGESHTVDRVSTLRRTESLTTQRISSRRVFDNSFENPKIPTLFSSCGLQGEWLLRRGVSQNEGC